MTVSTGVRTFKTLAMAIKPFLFATSLWVFYCCNSWQVSNNVQKEKTSGQATVDSIPQCIPQDTMTSFGIKIHYLYNNGEYRILWGNATFQRISDDAYTCEEDEYGGIWDFIPKLEAETKNNVILKNILFTSSGANPAPIEFTAFILPENNTDTIQEIPFYITCIGNYLIYAEPFTKDTLYILNIETKESQTIVLTPAAAVGRTIAFSLQDLSIKKGILYIEYEALNKKEDVYIEKNKFNIRI